MVSGEVGMLFGVELLMQEWSEQHAQSTVQLQ